MTVTMRAWDKIEKKWLEDNKFVVDGSGRIHRVYESWELGNFGDGQVTIELAIGQSDTDNKPVFVGDIVEFVHLHDEGSDENGDDPKMIGIVGVLMGSAYVFLDSKMNPIRQWNDGSHEWYSLENNYSLTIIGNIHENPELIKKAGYN